MAVIAKNTARLSANQLAAKGDFILERMTGNPAFPTPTPTLDTLATAIADLRAAITAALDGGKTATAIRKARQRELTLLINQLAGYISSVAEGNALAILSSGFEVRGKRQPAPEPGTPRNLRAYITDHTGRVDLAWAPVEPAVTYHIQATSTDPQDEKGWQLAAVSTRASAKLTGLPSGQIMHFRVAGIGTKGIGPWSQVASTWVK